MSLSIPRTIFVTTIIPLHPLTLHLHRHFVFLYMLILIEKGCQVVSTSCVDLLMCHPPLFLTLRCHYCSYLRLPLYISLLQYAFLSSFPSSSSPVFLWRRSRIQPSTISSIKSTMVRSVYEVRRDGRVPELVRHKTAVPRNEGRRQEWSGRSRSVSRAGPQQPSQGHHPQPLEQPSRQDPSQKTSQSQPGQDRPHLSPQIPLYDDRYASDDESVREEDEFPERSYNRTAKDPGGRRRDATIAAPIPESRRPGRQREPLHSRSPYPASPLSSSAHPSPHPRITRNANVGRGDSDSRNKVGGPEPLYDPRGSSSRTRPDPPHSPPHSQTPLNQGITSQPAPRVPLPASISHGLRHPPLYSSLGHAHPQAQNSFPRPQSRESNRRRGDDSRLVVGSPSSGQNVAPSQSRAPPQRPPSVSRYELPSERNTAHTRSGFGGEGTRERERNRDDESGRRANRSETESSESEMGFQERYRADMADGRGGVKKEGTSRREEEEFSAAMANAHLYPRPHVSGVPSHQQPPPPPPPYHTRPRPLGVPQQRPPPAHPAAAASYHPPPRPPPSSAARPPHVDRSIPTAVNARDSLFGHPNLEKRDDGCDDRGDRRADGLESTSRNPYLRPSSRQQPLPPPPPQDPGRFDTRSRPLSGMPQHQHRQRPAHPAAAARPPPPAAVTASDHSDSSSSSSSSVVPRSSDLSATSYGNTDANANTNASSTAPRGGRFGAANTVPEPRVHPGPKRERTRSVSRYGSARNPAELPGSPPIKTGERGIPPQQRRPIIPAPRNVPLSSPITPPPRNPVHTNGTNTGPRAAEVDGRNIGSALGDRRDGIRSVTVGAHGHGRSPAVATKFPKPPSPRWEASGRWGEPPRRVQSTPPVPGSGGQRIVRRPEPKPTLTQRVGYKLWVTALGCL